MLREQQSLAKRPGGRREGPGVMPAMATVVGPTAVHRLRHIFGDGCMETRSADRPVISYPMLFLPDYREAVLVIVCRVIFGVS